MAGNDVISTVTSASPTSTSAYPQSLAVVVKVCVASSLGLADPPEVVGASFVFETTMSKSSVTVPPLLSSQVTLTDRVPTLAFSGVPVNCLSLAAKVSHPGSAFPLVSVAV